MRVNDRLGNSSIELQSCLEVIHFHLHVTWADATYIVKLVIKMVVLNSCYRVCHIEKMMSKIGDPIFNGIKRIPSKVNIVAWRVGLDRIPQRLHSQQKKTHVESMICSLCGAQNEFVNYLFISCPLASEIWVWSNLIPGV